ncbi:MAG: PAS domain S-box protein, partial [Anaerolineae bacterium]|nr:PAS domain S-box protein [Anaerolineae bacterium]
VEQVMPPCIVIDKNHAIIHAFGEVQQYLRPPVGYQVSLDISTMIREELTLPINTALYRINQQDQEEFIYRNITLQDENEPRQIHLTVRPFWEPNSRQRLTLLTFEAVAVEDHLAPQGEVFDINQTTTQRINNLEQELQYTRENLQATIEELETANEELQATNEELLAANEELQSTNEELQSVNEELLTVNTEYQVKIRELTALNDDVNNLLKNTNIGTIFLDYDLNLRKFTPAVQDDVNLLEQDIGRPLDHITHHLKDVDLVRTAQKVLDTQTGTEQEVQSNRGKWFQLRAMPYYTHAEQIDGVVLTLVDFTNLKRARLLIEDLDRARSYLDEIDTLVLALNKRGEITFINQAGYELLGYSEKELLGKNWFFTCLPRSHREEVFKEFQKMMAGELEPVQHQESPVLKADRHERLIAWGNTLIRDESDQIVGLLSSGIDITERVLAEDKFQKLLEFAPEALIIVNDRGAIAVVNAQAEKMFGYKRADLLGQPLEMLLPERFREQHQSHRAAYLAQPQPRPMGLDLSLFGLRRDGQEFPVEISLSPLETEEGLLIMSAVRDITRRKQAQQALRDSEARLRAFVEALPDLTFIFDREGRYLETIASDHHLLYRELEELKGRFIHEMLPEDVAELFMTTIHKTLETEQTQRVQYTLDVAAGKTWFEARTSPLSQHDGPPDSVIWVAYNVTQRKRIEDALKASEARFRTIFEEGPLGMAVINLETFGFHQVNNRLCQMLGYSEAELTKLTFPNITHPDDIDTDVDLARRLIQGEIPYYKLEKRYLTKAKEPIRISLTASLLRDGQGTPLFGLAMIEDISGK